MLTTSTPGVTVTQASSAYPNLDIDASGANTTPFQFETSSSFVCGTAISFSLTLTYAGGNKVGELQSPHLRWREPDHPEQLAGTRPI